MFKKDKSIHFYSKPVMKRGGPGGADIGRSILSADMKEISDMANKAVAQEMARQLVQRIGGIALPNRRKIALNALAICEKLVHQLEIRKQISRFLQGKNPDKQQLSQITASFMPILGTLLDAGVLNQGRTLSGRKQSFKERWLNLLTKPNADRYILFPPNFGDAIKRQFKKQRRNR